MEKSQLLSWSSMTTVVLLSVPVIYVHKTTKADSSAWNCPANQE